MTRRPTVRRRGLLAVGCAIVAAFATVALAQTPEELYGRGNRAYQEGRFAEAYDAYRAAMQFSIEDARLEYNLGNAAFKLGKLGEAILHYERAYRLAPTDPDVRANLEYARTFLRDRLEPQREVAPLRWLRDAQNRFGPDRHAVAMLVWVWTIGLVVAWFARRPGAWRPVAGWILAAALVGAVATGVSWRMTEARLEADDRAIVLVEAVRVLSGPSDNHAALVTVHEGLALTVRTKREGWVQVTLPDGLSGWVPEGTLGFV